MRKYVVIGIVGGLALACVAAVSAVTEVLSGDALALKEVESQCAPTRNEYRDWITPPKGMAIASETRFGDDVIVRRYVTMACFIKKVGTEYEFHYRPAQFSLWL